jgi:5-(carboxyamino)imidazole ribonucleotide synthase
VSPPADRVAIAQDRIREKAHFARCAAASGVAPAPHAVIESEADLAAVPDALLPGILKRRAWATTARARPAWPRAELAGLAAHGAACVLEQRLPLAGAR